jgi:hypothetical protein
MKRLLLILLFLSVFYSLSQSQDNEYSQFLSENTSGDLFFEVQSHAFFDNLEFTNDIQKGYTLTGFNFEPRVAYSINSKAKISAGLHFLYFAGEEKIARATPVLTLQAKLSPNFTLNLGTIEARGSHQLPEQIFKLERGYINQPETGLQLLYNSDFIDADTWINWEQFIYRGDTIQEEFTAGVSTRIKLNSLKSVAFNIPIYALAVHSGGQINDSNEPVSTLANFGTGLNISYLLDNNSIIGAEGLAFLGRDLSPTPHHIYKKGWAIYPKVYYRNNLFVVDIGYWRASQLILPRGEDIFGSLSTVNPVYNDQERELVTSNFVIRKEIAEGFLLSFGNQFYYDLSNTILDYRFYITFSFNESFSIRSN